MKFEYRSGFWGRTVTSLSRTSSLIHHILRVPETLIQRAACIAVLAPQRTLILLVRFLLLSGSWGDRILDLRP